MYTWLKALESKVNNLNRELSVLKEGLLKKNIDLRKDIKTLNDELLELRRGHETTLQKMDLMIKELKQTAGVEDVMVIKKYMEYWNPLNFVTQGDLQRAVEARWEQQSRKEQRQKE